jgi:WD40 repeat protein
MTLALSPDGRRVVSGSEDGTLRLLSAESGETITTTAALHHDRVLGVAFSHDGRYIVSGGIDKTIRIWDAATARPIGIPLEGHGLWVQTVNFSPDGRSIVSGSSDGRLMLWPGPAAWSDEICGKLTRDISPQQWHEWISPEIADVQVCRSPPTSSPFPGDPLRRRLLRRTP